MSFSGSNRPGSRSQSWSRPTISACSERAARRGLIPGCRRGIENDLYFQVGLVTLIGQAAKNAILIVEFAVLCRAQGMGSTESALEASRLRFRPIIMTSLAFILGVVPLAISSGAGSASRHSIGTGVIGGMLAATVLAIFLIPMFYLLVESLAEKLGKGRNKVATPV